MTAQKPTGKQKTTAKRSYHVGAAEEARMFRYFCRAGEQTTLEQVSEHFKRSRSTVKKLSRENSWRTERKRLHAAAAKRAEEKIIDKTADDIVQLSDIRNDYAAKLHEKINAPGFDPTVDEFLAIERLLSEISGTIGQQNSSGGNNYFNFGADLSPAEQNTRVRNLAAAIDD
jgi:hypothetical protein